MQVHARIPRIISPHFACVDLFSGCGGNSWGMLHEDGKGQLVPVFALDNEPSALFTYHMNMPWVELALGDIRFIEPETVMSHAHLEPGDLGCLIASPPCQTFSRNNRGPKSSDDHRHTLYVHTIKMIRGLRPWVLFMENVPEMATCNDGSYHRDFLDQLTDLGYVCKHWIVDAAQYGVPQHRMRLIYLAYHNDMKSTPECPPATHGDSDGREPFVTVEEAIGDLPPLHVGDERDRFFTQKADYAILSPYARARRPTMPLFVFNHHARMLSGTQLNRLEELQEGEALEALPAELRPKQGYRASYGRLWRSKPAPTLTTFLAYPGCGRFSHYEQDRTITIREALRLQSFDDDFHVGGILIEQSSQIGNAVPPLLAAAFKRVIVNELERFFGEHAPHPISRDARGWRSMYIMSEITMPIAPLLPRTTYPELRRALRDWAQTNGRGFAWRSTHDPYPILLAEVVLQKTQVVKAEKAYHDLIQKYPSIQTLAAAPLTELETVFQWLGLQKRARLLKQCAQEIVEKHGGQVPPDIKALKRLPGIGSYSANAILCFAYDEPTAIVDTPIARTLKRILGFETNKKAWEDRATWEIARDFLDPDQPAAHNYALIDLAAQLCLPNTPCCWQCPIQPWCSYASALSGSMKTTTRSGNDESVEVRDASTV